MVIIGGSGPERRPRHERTLRDAATTPRALRRWNDEVILDVLRSRADASVTELVSSTGLSRPTVNAAVDELVDLGLVVDKGPDPAEGRRGRPGRRLAFRADRGHVLGLDVGEFTARAAVADLRGDIVVERWHEFTDVSRGGTHRIDAVRRLADNLLAEAGLRVDQLLAACVGISGGVDPASGTVVFSGALPTGIDLEDALGLPCPVVVENDANLAALAERWRGGARGVDNVVCVLASERMGAGLLVEGHLVRGHGGAAGEMAFLGPFAEDTGAHGISYYARTLGAEAVRGLDPPAGDRGQPEDLWTLSGGDPDAVDAVSVFRAARAGDPVAVDVVERAVRMPARATATLALVLDPELVVIGGAVAHAGATLLDSFRATFDEFTRIPPRLIVSPLAERGVLVGAVRGALDEVEPRLLELLGTDEVLPG